MNRHWKFVGSRCLAFQSYAAVFFTVLRQAPGALITLGHMHAENMRRCL